MRIGESILLCIAILLNYVQAISSHNLTHLVTAALLSPAAKHTIWYSDSISTTTTAAHVPSSLNHTKVSVNTTLSATSLSTTNTMSSYNFETTVLTSKQSMPLTPSLTKTSIHQTSTVNPKPSSTTYPTHKSPSPTPTRKKQPKTTSSGGLLAHKVGLIVGIILGLILLSVCLIVFHKKETRIKCLKLMCKPCTKNYSSRYNIVPIYVYDDNEQDIRELQDDSDLPLV